MMTAHWTCWLWTMLGAGLLGWGIKGVVLGTVMDDKRREMERLTNKIAALTKLANQPPEVRTVEKRVEVPVERVVVKHVEVPVEKVVDRPVDNPEHLARIKVLEGEVAVIAGLFTQIAQLKTLSSQTGERRAEGQVVVPVDNPDQLERIKALEEEVAVITELRAQIAELQAASSPAGEKVVEKHIEPPAEQIAEKNGEVPVEKMSEHTGTLDPACVVERADKGEAVEESPDDLKLIRGVGPALERFLHKRGVLWFSQVATWSHKDIDKFEFLLPNFGGRIQRENWVRSAQIEHYKKYQQWLGDGEPPNESLEFPTQIAELRAAPSAAGERVAEKGTETLTEKIGAGSVDMINDPARNPDQVGVVGQSDEGQAEGELPDDLKQIRGVGPGLERFLHKRGVFWFSQVATWSQADIDKFEFLLPNFGGRIQRENWVHSAKVEYYKKYKQWLGDGEPPSESLASLAQMTQPQDISLPAGEKSVEARIETPAETNGAMLVGEIPDQAGDQCQAGAVEQLDEEQTASESSDDLKQIRGVGPGLERFLHKRGVFWFSQVATWSQADIDKFEFLLPNFGGRIQRENWVHSAKVEHYKKYKQWLGDGEPSSTSPETL